MNDHLFGAGRLHQGKTKRASHCILVKLQQVPAGRRGAEISKDLAGQHCRQSLAKKRPESCCQTRLNFTSGRDRGNEPAAVDRRGTRLSYRKRGRHNAHGDMYLREFDDVIIVESAGMHRICERGLRGSNALP